MTTFLYISGLLLGVAVFLYLLSIYDSGKNKYNRITGKVKKKNDNERNSKIESKNITCSNLTNIPPGERMCPVCRKSLTKFEPLYASNIETDSGSRVLIYGCGYCYKTNGKKG